MRSIDRMVVYHGTILVEHRYIDEDHPIRLIPYRPWQTDVLPSVEDQTIAEAVRVLAYSEEPRRYSYYHDTAAGRATLAQGWVSSTPQLAGKEVYYLWTRDTVRVVDGSWKDLAAPQENPYGELPFTIIRNEEPWGRFWVRGIAEQLMRGTQALDIQYSELYDTGLALYGIPVCTGAVRPGTNFWSRFAPVEFAEAGGDLKFVGTQANIDGHIKIIHELLYALALSCHIPPGVFMAEFYQQRDRSGRAIDAVAMGPGAWRDSRMLLFTATEREMHQRSADIYRAHTGLDVSPDLRISFEATTMALDSPD
jgi:hypothetical protein